MKDSEVVMLACEQLENGNFRVKKKNAAGVEEFEEVADRKAAHARVQEITGPHWETVFPGGFEKTFPAS